MCCFSQLIFRIWDGFWARCLEDASLWAIRAVMGDSVGVSPGRDAELPSRHSVQLQQGGHRSPGDPTASYSECKLSSGF